MKVLARKVESSVQSWHIISFSRLRQKENTTFEFLGFEFRWGKSRKGKDSLKRGTSRSKLRKLIVAFKEWCKENRNNRIRNLIPKLNRKLRGYYNYYGLIGNYKSLSKFYMAMMKILYKWLNRRSQRASIG
ncbi:group II intron maturase-specific domain-containing protein [Paenibacillus sp. DS2015]|uniref:group II intron maturase-specific domain-containing protein n=1 Tax=Paenibacillus sp. DS2015 TaxID=3373917 RepID=UPI003D19A016